MSVDLMLLANSATINVVFYKRRETWPPVVLANKFLCAKVPRVTSRQGVVLAGYDFSAEIEVVRHIASILVKQ